MVASFSLSPPPPRRRWRRRAGERPEALPRLLRYRREPSLVPPPAATFRVRSRLGLRLGQAPAIYGVAVEAPRSAYLEARNLALGYYEAIESFGRQPQVSRSSRES